MKTETYNKAITWIKNNVTDDCGGIILSSERRVLYPEVTGYFIPSLLHAGETELAISFAKKLCAIQKADGSWNDSYDIAPYIFDSAQILKGLLAVREIYPEADAHILAGVDWILSNMTEQGQLLQPDQSAWGAKDSFCNELIHTYSISPIFEAADRFNREDYREKAQKILDYYVTTYRDRIDKFSLFAHFYAYVMEAMVDCGRADLAIPAMKKLEKVVRRDGAIPGYPDVSWVCSTAMFQFAIVWYKLGQRELADRTFSYACSLQNETGGWYGSYGVNMQEVHRKAILAKFGLAKDRDLYLPDEEISWAVKFYLDAAYLKEAMRND